MDPIQPQPQPAASTAPQAASYDDQLATLRKEGRILVIDDDIGVCISTQRGLSMKAFGFKAEYFQVTGISGADKEEKTGSFREKLTAHLAAKFDGQAPNLIILDRNLKIGDLHSENDEGPVLIPVLKELFPGVKILGYTGEGNQDGMAQKFGGFVVAKPASLVEELVPAMVAAYFFKAD